MQREHEHPSLKRPADGGEARCGDLLKNGHQESESTALIAFPPRQVEAVFQILPEFFIKAPLLVAHHERFRVHPAAREERAAVWSTGVRLGPSKHNRVQAVTVLDHLFGATKERGIEKLDEHPELEMVSLMRCRG